MFDHTESCIDKIERWLKFMGIDSIQRNGNAELEVRLQTSNIGHKYILHFYFFQDRFLIESFVFKGVSGKPQNVELFQRALLAYNGAAAIERISFAYIPLKNGEPGVVMQTSQNCASISIEELKNILDSYNVSYAVHIPKIKEMIDELDLNFMGKGPDLRTILKNILNG